MTRPTSTPTPADDANLYVQPLDWNPLDAGYIAVSNYFMRFWWPAIGTTAATAYLQLLTYSRPGVDAAYPSLLTLEQTLGIDRRSLYGRTLRGTWQPGAFDTLQRAGLLVIRHEPAEDIPWRFFVARRPGLLTPDLVAALPRTIQRRHAEWLARSIPNACSPVKTEPPPVMTEPPPVETERTTQPTATNNRERYPASEKKRRTEEAVEVYAADVSSAAEVVAAHDQLSAWWRAFLAAIPTEHAELLAPSVPVALAGGTLTLSAPETTADYLQETYGPAIIRRWPSTITTVRFIPHGERWRVSRRFEP